MATHNTGDGIHRVGSIHNVGDLAPEDITGNGDAGQPDEDLTKLRKDQLVAICEDKKYPEEEWHSFTKPQLVEYNTNKRSK